MSRLDTVDYGKYSISIGFDSKKLVLSAKNLESGGELLRQMVVVATDRHSLIEKLLEEGRVSNNVEAAETEDATEQDEAAEGDEPNNADVDDPKEPEEPDWLKDERDGGGG